MKNTHEEIEQARQLLKANGYYVDNLWMVDDVQSRFNCDQDTAQEILDNVMTCGYTMETIWDMIEISAQENFKLKPIENY